MKAIIDVREWQTTVDMLTGYPCGTDFPEYNALSALAAKYPYPGDKGTAGIKWVYDMAREFQYLRDPDFMCLTLPQIAIAGKHRPMSDSDRTACLSEITESTASFAAKYGYRTVIVGTGVPIPHRGFINPIEIDGLFQSNSWTNIYAGVFHAGKDDLEKVRAMEHLSLVLTKDEIAPYSRNVRFTEQLPDILVRAERGMSFKVFSSNNSPLYSVEQENDYLPVYSEIGTPDHIESVNGLMNAALDRGEKILLAVVEGVDGNDFESVSVPNRRDWYAYAGNWLYYTLGTGKTLYDFYRPPVYEMGRVSDFPVRYPFSLASVKPCADAIGARKDKRTVCVGSRSITSHSLFNCDLTAECFVRSLVNMGTMIILR